MVGFLNHVSCQWTALRRWLGNQHHLETKERQENEEDDGGRHESRAGPCLV